MQQIDILYFAWVRERIGRDGERLEVPTGVIDVAGVVGWLAGQGGAYADALGDLSRLRYALDGAFVGADAPLGQAHELAIFPPVTGG